MRCGSIRRAAIDVGVGAATVSRAIDRLETTLGFKLFNRVPEGLRITDDGRAILDDVERIDRAAVAIVRRARFRGAPLRGVVKVAISEGLGNYWVIPQLIEFTASNRLLTVELNCTTELMDIARLQSDIFVQFHRPTNPDLIVVKLGRLHRYPFVSVEYERLHGVPKNVVEARKHRIIQQMPPVPAVDALQKRLAVDTLEGIIGVRTNTSAGVLYAVERGAGIGWLPTYCLAFGARFVPVDLEVHLDLEVHHFLDIYLAYHPDVRESENHLAVIEWLRQIFDPVRYPCFSDAFIHPVDLVPMMSGVARMLGGLGYLAVDPTGHGSQGKDANDGADGGG
jgi:DNA-binding transcriptional LysR family regulator